MDFEALIEDGYTVIPLKGKIPVVKWATYVTNPPSQHELLANFMYADRVGFDGVGLVCGPATGILCLDFDKPPFLPSNMIGTSTRRGMHYYFKWHEKDNFQLGVRPGVDIPRMAKLHGPIFIHETPCPITAAPRPADRDVPLTAWEDKDLPSMEDLNHCAFIRWFKERRTDSSWDGRYPLARAYASNAAKTLDPDLVLGTEPGAYRHENTVLSSLPFPIRCETIMRHWQCPVFDQSLGACSLAPSASTPHGLAQRIQARKQCSSKPPEQLGSAPGNSTGATNTSKSPKAGIFQSLPSQKTGR